MKRKLFVFGSLKMSGQKLPSEWELTSDEIKLIKKTCTITCDNTSRIS